MSSCTGIDLIIRHLTAWFHHKPFQCWSLEKNDDDSCDCRWYVPHQSFAESNQDFPGHIGMWQRRRHWRSSLSVCLEFLAYCHFHNHCQRLNKLCDQDVRRTRYHKLYTFRWQALHPEAGHFHLCLCQVPMPASLNLMYWIVRSRYLFEEYRFPECRQWWNPPLPWDRCLPADSDTHSAEADWLIIHKVFSSFIHLHFLYR